MSTSSSRNVKPQVFINFRGIELRNTFVAFLHGALRRKGINAFIDSDEQPGVPLKVLFERIEKSTVALAILSSRYTESHWCLDELVKIRECADRNTLRVIPIFYMLNTSIVKNLEGDFGLQLWNLWRQEDHRYKRDDRILKWDAALQDAAGKTALRYTENSNLLEFVDQITKHVQNMLSKDKLQREENPKPQGSGGENPKPEEGSNRVSRSIKPGEQNLKQLKERLDVDCNDDETRIVGVVGMVGIGKTYLAEKLLAELKTKIGRDVFIKCGNEKSKEQELDELQKKIVEGLLKEDHPNLRSVDRNALEVRKSFLLEKKVVVVLDGVGDKKQIDAVLQNQGWIKNGSRIVITTRDKSLLNGLACDIYEVPKLNDRDSFELFRAQIFTTIEGSFVELARKFVDYAGGNPLALKEYGGELNGNDKDHWERTLGTLTQRVREELRSWYDELTEQQKDAFLDIAYFFRSEDENYVRTLLDSFDPELRDLADKFLINVCDGRVEMHDLLFTMVKELVEDTSGKYRLLSSNSADFTSALRNKEVRGIILDMSKKKEMPLDNQAFVGMSSLRYLKVYNSLFPRHSEAECKLNLPDEIEFPKDNIVRYIDWMKFSRKELPSNFEPKNLIDLRLPYSKITRLWNFVKITPKLKWVDLSHSSKLSSLSGLSEAPNLLRLNLEGCTSLKDLSEEMQKMKNLVFLNLRGCTSLLSLPSFTIHSLKTLILSGCSSLENFKVISENLETLHLNSTAICELPSDIDKLQRLILLNLKDCKNLSTLPDSLGKLRSLQELKLSRCSKIKIFPNVKEKVENLRLLMLDETSITEMPCNSINLYFLQSLCLSRNDKLCSLQFDMSHMFHLKWLELKYCKNLTSLPSLPPNLQCLNAYGCTSLKTVASPLASHMPTKQIHYSTFIFTNCDELEQVARSSIISYVQKKSSLMSNDQYNQDFVFKSLIGTCFPGCDLPAWFDHKAFGSELNLEFPRDWNEGKLNGIALCVVVSFGDYKDQNNGLQVRCTCEFNSVSLSRESFIIGGWSEPGDEPQTIGADHVFIGYTTLFNIKKRQQFSSATKVCLSFQVTNGTSKVAECKVMKCGVTLVYEADEVVNTSCEENIDATPRMEDGQQGQTSAYKGAQDDEEDCIGEANSGTIPKTEDYKKEKGVRKFFRRVL
ncbi:unnamed protein product [Thlaspi arvense]|uniref:ADP-ribosyl cyclase/cyclic ADP-ribose hydrolase n=1 Tax=Thlaspi arvense TaxID=13288 RepID=A0AAU9RNC8_THLAR|nr:unnamed protein product [Thlaspi arvense]